MPGAIRKTNTVVILLSLRYCISLYSSDTHFWFCVTCYVIFCLTSIDHLASTPSSSLVLFSYHFRHPLVPIFVLICRFVTLLSARCWNLNLFNYSLLGWETTGTPFLCGHILYYLVRDFSMTRPNVSANWWA